jgi:hypothetical protein
MGVEKKHTTMIQGVLSIIADLVFLFFVSVIVVIVGLLNQFIKELMEFCTTFVVIVKTTN